MSNIVKGLTEAVDISAMQQEYRTRKADILKNADAYSKKYGIPADDKYFAEKVMQAQDDEVIRTKQQASTDAAAQQQQASMHSDKQNVEQLKAQLAQLQKGFDPNYQYSDDYSFVSKQQRIADQISQLKKRISNAEGMNETKEAGYGPKFQSAVQALKQMAKEGPRKTVWDPVKRVYKTVPVNTPKKEEGVAEGEYKSRHIHRQEQNKKYDEYRRSQEAAGKKPLSRGDWAATQRKGQQGVAEGFADIVKGVKRKVAGKEDPKEVEHMYGRIARSAIKNKTPDQAEKDIERYKKISKVVNKEGVAEGHDIPHWRVEQSETTGRYYVVTGYTSKSRRVWKSKQGAGDFSKRADAEAKAQELNQGVAEADITRRGFLRGLGAAALGAAAGNVLAGSNDPGFIRKVQDKHIEMAEKNPRYEKEHAALQLPMSRGFTGNALEMNKRWAEKTAELLAKYGVTVNEGVTESVGQLSIQQLATISDEALDKAYGYGRSTPGNSFGWQANLMSAAYAKKMIDAGVTDIEKISDAIHKGWNVTAQKFVQNPNQFDDTEKLRQAGKLEAKLAQRAKLMKINYAQLDNDEQEKDRVVARALLQAIKGQQGVAENLEEAVGDNYLYHATQPAGMMRILRTGVIKASDRPQAATKAKTNYPTISTTRSKHYAESEDFVDFLNLTRAGNAVIIVFDRNAVANHYKMFSTSQGTQTVGDEYEEVIVVPKGTMPIQGTMKGFYFNPRRSAEIQEFENTPWFKELLNSPYYMGQKQGVAEEEQVDENLHKWFKEKWVRFGPDGKIRGACARGDDSEGKPKCLPQAKAHSLGKKGRKYAAAKKRREDPNPERRGPAKNVATKKKSNEGALDNASPTTKETMLQDKINSLKNLIAIAKEQGRGVRVQELELALNKLQDKLDEACWKGYHKEGMKTMFGKKYPNCVKNTNEEQELDEKWSEKYKRSIDCSNPKGFSQKAHCAGRKKNEDIEEAQQCPKCGGPMFSELLINEKKDACYYKVKSRYKVWPSAYASGALVQCRKKGASNWGTKSESVSESENFEESFDMKINELDMVNEDWQKVNKKDKTDGMSRKAVKAYRRENPGSKLKTAVTTKPSKLKKGSKAAKRRKSFCARMSGMKKSRASAKTKRDPNSPINKALRRWNCESVEQMQKLVMIAENKIAEAKNAKQQAAIAIAKKAKMNEADDSCHVCGQTPCNCTHSSSIMKGIKK